MMNVAEIKPVTIQHIGKIIASVKYVAIIQTLKKSFLEHLSK